MLPILTATILYNLNKNLDDPFTDSLLNILNMSQNLFSSFFLCYADNLFFKMFLGVQILSIFVKVGTWNYLAFGFICSFLLKVLKPAGFCGFLCR